MKLKNFRTALIAALFLGAVMATNASAAATTTVEPWRTGSSATETAVLTGTQAMTLSLTGPSVTEVEIGETPIKIESGEIECVECTIFNEAGGAKGEGKLKLKKVVVLTPSSCEVQGGQIVTNTVSIDATYMINAAAYLSAVPTGTAFYTLKLQAKTGKTCAISGSYISKGSIFFEVANVTGTYATSQVASTSGAINAAAGGALLLGTKVASLAATAKFEAGGKFFDVE